MILELHRQGVSISAIARRVGFDRKTVRRYIAQGLEPPTYGPRQPRATQLRAYEPYLRQRLAAFPQLSGRRLHRELRDLGYRGGYTILTDLLREIPSVVHPFIAPEKYRTATRRKNVTLINPHPRKGGDIGIAIARQCPEIPFVFVESWPLSPEERRELNAKLATVPNVVLMPPQSDMRRVYAECKLLLVPSVWEEAYGRVATEAQISGIPVIASTRGGLPEAVGPGGILLDPDQPVADWVAAVRGLWTDHDQYSALSAAAIAYAARPEISFDRQVEGFERAMLDAAGCS